MFITAATEYVAAMAGIVQTSTVTLAKSAAAVRAAAMVELAYPERDEDVSVADALNALADELLTALVAANTVAGGAPTTPAGSSLPQYSFPDPVAWGDTLIL